MRAVGDEIASGDRPTVMRREIGTRRSGVGHDDGIVIEQPGKRRHHLFRPDRGFIARSQRRKISKLGVPRSFRPANTLLCDQTCLGLQRIGKSRKRQPRIGADGNRCRIVGR